MATNRVIRSVLLAAGVLMIAACASHPVSSPASATYDSALLEKKFERVTRYYQKYQHDGQLVYCKRGATQSMPPTECITESALRVQVENTQRSRNSVTRGGPQYVASVPGNPSGN